MTGARIAELLQDASRRLEEAGVDDSRLEAEVLVAHACGVSRTRLLAMLRDVAPGGACARSEELISRRARREPAAYITGKREFYGLEIVVRPGVLIPRPETELLVEIAVEFGSRLERPRVADVGTGSGAVAVAVARSLPRATVVAMDTSVDALRVAAENAAAHGVEARIRLVEADLLGGGGPFDVILANLPYVSEAQWSQLEPEVRVWEPREALVGGREGTECNERLLGAVPGRLAPSGVLAVECGAGQTARLRQAAGRNFPEAEIVVRTDLAGIDRVLVIKT